MTLTRRSFLAALLVCTLAACREARPLPPERAILILISIDGFRGTISIACEPPTLSKLAAEGVQADGLIPQFPSKTFPNHYTIVTGLTLAHHGIISNNIRDAATPGRIHDVEPRRAMPTRDGGAASRSGIRRRSRAKSRARCSGLDRKRSSAAARQRTGCRSTTRCRTASVSTTSWTGCACPTASGRPSSRSISAMSTVPATAAVPTPKRSGTR